MDRYDFAALTFLEEASDNDWMCFARLYLDNFHKPLGLWMVHQRRCPEAVALALYWYSQPGICSKYQGRAIPSYHSIEFAVFKAVERYFSTGFYNASDLGFDPSSDLADPMRDGTPQNWTEGLHDNSQIPSRMFNAVEGRSLDVLAAIESWREGLPPNLAELVFDQP